MGLFSYLIVLPIIYAVVAIPFIFINRRKDKNYVALNPVHADDASIYADKAARGKTGAQISSFVCTIILIIIALIGVLSMVPSLLGLSSFEAFGSAVILAAMALLVMTPVTIIVNAFWIYPKKIRLAEAYAFANNTATKLLKIERISAWVVWILYGIFGVGITVVAAGSFLNF
jgi:hypothetical protein